MKHTVSFGIIIFLLMFSSVSLPAQSPVLENGNIKVLISEDGAVTFTDKQNNVSWGSDYPGWIELSVGGIKEKVSLKNSDASQHKREGSLFVTFKGLSGIRIKDKDFEMRVRLSLAEKQLDIEIESLKTAYSLGNIEYPAHILTVKSGVENGYVVAPNLQGIMIPSRYDAGFMRYGQNTWAAISDIETFWSLECTGLNMPWFGASLNNSSVLAYVMTSSDCQLHLIGNAVVGSEGLTINNRQGLNPGIRLSSCSPVWLSSKQKLSYPRKIRFELVNNGYVGMARKYREYAIKSGRYVTMKEKIERNPEYAKLIGAPDLKIYCYTNRLNDPAKRAWCEPVLNGFEKVNTTFAQVAEISNDLKDMGVEKCMILLGGWNRLGYDNGHVDMWPPAEKCGGIEGLRNACQTVKGNGYLLALHDNYDDFYTDAPSYDEKYIIRKEDGSIQLGGVWDGGLCHIICPAERKGLLDRNLDLVQKHIPLNGYYCDVITSSAHYECYDERHKVTRKEDLEYRFGLLRDIQDRGLVMGGEGGTDWAVPSVAFFEGLSGGGTGFHYGITYKTGINIPLFWLVYHDCVIGYWQHGTPYGREDHANHVLLDLLSTQPSSWSIEYEQWDDIKPLLKQTYDLLGRLHEKTAFMSMTNHQILTNDYLVQKSTFEDGSMIWVNFGITTFESGDIAIPPKGFRVEIKGEPVKTGSVARTINYL